MPNVVASLDHEDRSLGRARCGRVTLRDFDSGVVLTLNPTKVGADYYITIATIEDMGITGVCPPPGLPGIPIIFGNPDDMLADAKMPMIAVMREGIERAMNRWHPGNTQYRAPAKGALPTVIEYPDGRKVYGYDSYEFTPQAVPFDISYGIQVLARNRGGVNVEGPRNQAGAIFHYVMSIYQPYCNVRVVDTIGDVRTYHADAESIDTEDELLDVTARKIGFRLSLRVQGEIDLNPPEVRRAVTQIPTIRSEIHDG